MSKKYRVTFPEYQQGNADTMSLHNHIVIMRPSEVQAMEIAFDPNNPQHSGSSNTLGNPEIFALCQYCQHLKPVSQMTGGFCPSCLLTCGQCNQRKPVTQFQKDSRNTRQQGRRGICSVCEKTNAVLRAKRKK